MVTALVASPWRPHGECHAGFVTSGIGRCLVRIGADPPTDARLPYNANDELAGRALRDSPDSTALVSRP